MSSSVPELSKSIGKFVLSGQTIFAAQEPPAPNFNVKVNVRYNEIDYELAVKLVRTVDMKDLENPDPRVSALPIKWFNILTKNFLRSMNFFEYGRNGKFYVPIIHEWTGPSTPSACTGHPVVCATWVSEQLFDAGKRSSSTR